MVTMTELFSFLSLLFFFPFSFIFSFFTFFIFFYSSLLFLLSRSKYHPSHDSRSLPSINNKTNYHKTHYITNINRKQPHNTHSIPNKTHPKPNLTPLNLNPPHSAIPPEPSSDQTGLTTIRRSTTTTPERAIVRAARALFAYLGISRTRIRRVGERVH